MLTRDTFLKKNACFTLLFRTSQQSPQFILKFYTDKSTPILPPVYDKADGGLRILREAEILHGFRAHSTSRRLIGQKGLISELRRHAAVQS